MKQWRYMTETEKMDFVVDEGPDEMVGFYTTKLGQYDVVILASKKYKSGLHRAATLEFLSKTPEGLIELTNEAGFDLGLTPEQVHERCQPPLPVTVGRRRKKAG